MLARACRLRGGLPARSLHRGVLAQNTTPRSFSVSAPNIASSYRGVSVRWTDIDRYSQLRNTASQHGGKPPATSAVPSTGNANWPQADLPDKGMNNTTETGKETQAPVPTVVPIAVEARLASTDSEITSLNSRLGIKLFGEPSESVEFRLCSLKLLVGDCSDDKNALSLVGRVKKLEGDVGPTPDKDSASIQSRRRSLTSLVGRVKKLEGDLGTKETGEPWSVEKRLRRLTKDVMFDSNYALSLSRRVKNLEWNVGTKSSNEPYGNL